MLSVVVIWQYFGVVLAALKLFFTGLATGGVGDMWGLGFNIASLPTHRMTNGRQSSKSV